MSDTINPPYFLPCRSEDPTIYLPICSDLKQLAHKSSGFKSHFSDSKITTNKQKPKDHVAIIAPSRSRKRSRMFIGGSKSFSTAAETSLENSVHVFRLVNLFNDKSKYAGTGFLIRYAGEVIALTALHNLFAENACLVSTKMYFALQFCPRFYENPAFDNIPALRIFPSSIEIPSPTKELLSRDSLDEGNSRQIPLNSSWSSSPQFSPPTLPRSGNETEVSISSHTRRVLCRDIAVIKPQEDIEDWMIPFELCTENIDYVETQQEIYIIGYPDYISAEQYHLLQCDLPYDDFLRSFAYGLERMVVSRGKVTSVESNLCFHDVNTTAGISGGPVFSSSGKLLGIHIGSRNNAFIPIHSLKEELDRAMQTVPHVIQSEQCLQ